ncbi:AFG1-like ATPase-domain-containing protein [Naematelia encephala]|uniref:AFG1-like ATPase-domain-containing protein n=1 Tax=Naematelia encephala TaxID=71784 RepID=A0A1Y2BIY3_9TREE|nr:AFG1-like ATPase-domain-containing protein [Naematelia encephala]
MITRSLKIGTSKIPRLGPLLRHHGRIVALSQPPSSRYIPGRRYTSSTATTPSNPSDVETKQDLLEYYRSMVTSGRLNWDDEQVRVIMKLRKLLDELSEYTPPLDLLARLGPTAPVQAKRAVKGETSWWKGKTKADATEQEQALVRVLSGQEELENLRTPKGIMITGPPEGTGKSLLLSHFYALLPTQHKRRWHYHALTLHLYAQVFKEMQRRRSTVSGGVRNQNMDVAAKRGWKAVFAGGRWEGGEDGEVTWEEREETIPFVSNFDELQLLDASSAALLRDVLSWYWRLGGVIVTCSNRVPEDLYHHGVQKDRMAGFLDALKARCEVVELDGGRDWRQGAGVTDVPRNTWFVMGQAETEFDDAWDLLGGPQVRIPLANGPVARFDFSQLCEEALGPADYISIASTFSTIFIDKVPVLLLKHKNEARRLINLVDALYESRCQVFVQAEASPGTMFFPDALTLPMSDASSSSQFSQAQHTNEQIMAAESLSETLHLPSLPNVSLYNHETRAQREKREERESKTAGSFGVLGIWTGEDERFAYKRAVSRLVEMTTSPTYAKEAWMPLDQAGRAWEGKRQMTATPTLTTPSPSTISQLASPNPSIVSPSPGATLKEDESDDFAAEAGYSRPSRIRPNDPEDKGAPVISEHHVWGVTEEWGDKAGKWGKGAKAFGRGQGQGSTGESS